MILNQYRLSFMKKTLIALCITMASGSAMAWTTGDFNGSIDIGGSIEKTEYKAKWQWQSGNGFNTFTNTTNDLRNNGTKLVISVTEDKPILLGKTAEAFSSLVGGVAAVPNIAFSGYDSTPVSLQAVGSGDGTHYLELPIKVADGSDKIGTLRVNVTASGVVAKEGDSNILLNSLESTQNTEVFFGGLVSSAVIDSATTAAAYTAKFGSLSAQELQKQVQDASGNNTLQLTEGTSKVTETLVGQNGKVAAAAYAMGMSNGQTLEATFDKAITSETNWKAPMNIVVSYQ